MLHFRSAKILIIKLFQDSESHRGFQINLFIRHFRCLKVCSEKKEPSELKKIIAYFLTPFFKLTFSHLFKGFLISTHLFMG